MSNFEIGFEFVENELAFVDRLQVGSEEAFETLIHLYQAPIYNIAYRVLGEPAEAADAVQETFMTRIGVDRVLKFAFERAIPRWLPGHIAQITR